MQYQGTPARIRDGCSTAHREAGNSNGTARRQPLTNSQLP